MAIVKLKVPKIIISLSPCWGAQVREVTDALTITLALWCLTFKRSMLKKYSQTNVSYHKLCKIKNYGKTIKFYVLKSDSEQPLGQKLYFSLSCGAP